MRTRTLALAGLTTAAVAAGGISVASAATPSSAPTGGTVVTKHKARAPLHAEAVRRGKGGAFVTVGTQRGEVTAVSATSLTERSADGFTRTYVLTPDSKVLLDKKTVAATAVQVGQKAGVVALRTGDTWTVRRLAARS